MFVHRDAEGEPREKRLSEIQAAVEKLPSVTIPIVPVIPVRMQEAWLLFDEPAIRRAAGNPNGAMPLSLPRVRDIEHIPDPKSKLQDLLELASGLSRRRLKQLNLPHCARLVAEYIDDFKHLDVLPAFQALDSNVKDLVANYRWVEAPGKE